MKLTLLSTSDRSPAPAKKQSECSVLPFSQPEVFQFERHEDLHRRKSGGLWQIHSGYVRSLTWSPEGDVVPLGFWAKGDIVGDAILGRSESDAASTEHCQAQCLTRVSAEYLGKSYDCSQAVMLAQIRQSNGLLRIAYCRQSELRLLRFIGWLANLFGEPILDGCKVPIKLTHQEIAESIGSTRVTVTRLLKTLERKGKIRWTARDKMVYHKTLQQLR